MLSLRRVNGRNEDNAAAAVDFRIKIDVPEPRELDIVGEAFLRHLAREDATHDDVMRFSDETDGMANFYRDGLVSYLVAVATAVAPPRWRGRGGTVRQGRRR